MTVAIDCRFAAGRTGLGRYTREIARHLLMIDDGIDYILLVRSKEESWIPKASEKFRVMEADVPHYSIAEHTKLPAILRASKADLLFSPHFNVPISCPVPFVVTIHDLILHRFPNRSSWHRRAAYRLLMRHAVKRAAHAIAISEFVKSEIASFYGSRSNISVVREGMSGDYAPRSAYECVNIRAKYTITVPFFLYVGNCKQHKNVSLLIDAFVQSGVKDSELILVSSGAEADRLLPLPPGIRMISDVPDEDLPALYSATEAFVTASLYEGHCLPVAEALACGCPVIAANRAAIPETASGRAMLLEPTVENFAIAFQKRYAHQESFVAGTWEQTAAQTASIFESVLLA